MRLTQLATSRSDIFHLPRNVITISEGFNVRIDYGDLDSYARVILAEGVKRAVTGHKNEADQFIITEGHRTLRAFDKAVELWEEQDRLARIDGNKLRIKDLKAIKEANLTTIPVSSEPQGYTQKDRIFDMLNFNEGKPFTILEEGIAYQRLMKDEGVSESDILRRTGKSKTAFTNCMMLVNEGAPALIAAVKKGTFSSSLAIELVRKVKDHAEQTRLVNDAIGKATAAGRSAVSAKHLNDETREKVAPSKKGSRSRSSGGGGSPTPAATPLGSVPEIKQALDAVQTKKALTAPEEFAVKFPAKIKIAAKVLLARIGAAWVVAVQMKYPEANGFTGTDLDAEGASFPSRAAAVLEGLNMVNDGLQAAKRTDKTFAKAAKIDDALDAMKSILADARKAATKQGKADAKAATEAPSDRTPDDKGQESLVLDPEKLDANPADHIIGLRNKLRDDKRMAKKKGGAQFVTLNFVADYLEGGRYTPEEFEKFFTEYVVSGKQ